MEWLRFIRSFQIICLQETWEVDGSAFHLEGYKSFFVPSRTMVAERGGLIFVDLLLEGSWSNLNWNSDHMMGVRFQNRGQIISD